MNRFFLTGLFALVLLSAAPRARAALSPEQLAQLPKPAARRVDFVDDIKPLIESRCVKCHGRGKNKGDFSLETRASFLKGGESGPDALPGKSRESNLIGLVSGLDPDDVMPKKGSRLTPEQVGLLRAWIDQGIAWDTKITFARPEPLNLKPRRPAVPKVAGVTNAVDAFMRTYARRHDFAVPAMVNDRLYARRAWLDLIGLIPSAAELEDFCSSRDPAKREKLAARLLADRGNYAAHWLSFWNDALRNDYRGTGYIDGGRKQITAWLYSALATNMPYDQFVAQLVNPRPESEGFARGIVWRGVVNASQIPPMQAAQNISQVFAGVNLKCASCHDSFINDWTLADAYGLANLYSDSPLELFRCDQPTGRKAGYQFLYPELGAVSSSTNKAERLEQLARIITGPADGRLPRTMVNRLWARLFGRGLVEPLDDMDNPAWNQDLLDWLAEDLAAHQYDLKRTIYQVVTSRVYQWPSVNLPERVSTNFVFRGPGARRMSGEQFRDAVAELTGGWYDAPAGDFDFSCLAPAGAEGRTPDAPREKARWIWNRPDAASNAPAGTVYFRREFLLSDPPGKASAFVACDNRYTLFVNGRKAGEGKDHANPNRFDIRPFLQAGTNVLAVRAANDPSVADQTGGGLTQGRKDENAPETAKPPANPAGLIFYARIRQNDTTMEIISDRSWICSAEETDGWEKPEFAVPGWQPSFEVGAVSSEPWSIGQKWTKLVWSARFLGQTRAALANADPLQTAFGRPNREQVVTSRAAVATMLQALELTNGRELDGLLKKGADHWLASGADSSLNLVSNIYDSAFGRRPLPAEEQTALEMVGQPASREGLEDFLWAVCMHPEFQIIY
jgi:mono/diheme cytochrome c family protein